MGAHIVGADRVFFFEANQGHRGVAGSPPLCSPPASRERQWRAAAAAAAPLPPPLTLSTTRSASSKAHGLTQPQTTSCSRTLAAAPVRARTGPRAKRALAGGTPRIETPPLPSPPRRRRGLGCEGPRRPLGRRRWQGGNQEDQQRVLPGNGGEADPARAAAPPSPGHVQDVPDMSHRRSGSCASCGSSATSTTPTSSRSARCAGRAPPLARPVLLLLRTAPPSLHPPLLPRSSPPAS